MSSLFLASDLYTALTFPFISFLTNALIFIYLILDVVLITGCSTLALSIMYFKTKSCDHVQIRSIALL